MPILHPSLEQKARWREADRSRKANYSRFHKDELNAKRRERYKVDPEYRHRRLIALQTPHGRYIKLKADAKIRGLEMTISETDFLVLISDDCFYCGGVISPKGVGLDRIDSTLGYTLANVRPSCGKCNQAKNDLTEAEFRRWIKAIYERWAK